ncbi:MAG: CRISPR system precrRNA processing endoribonuclease RAMP protein Cas6 [Thermodesulfovibrionales bacterium]|nr:CRISPR system precrRNA processing endoribonuclease RAMP protein Cas6 [Thermodesulfovibrionales bacterium]
MQIPYQKFTFTLEAIEELNLPYYKGSTFRGGFGNVFRHLVCILKRQDCTDCMLKARCIYAYVFETPSTEGAEIMNMHRYERVPHPFVLEPPEGNSGLKTRSPENIPPGSRIDFKLILIGRATDYLPYFIYTFVELGNTGIGRGRGKYRLLEVKNGQHTVYSAQSKTIFQTEKDKIEIPEEFKPSGKSTNLSLEFITPLRMKYNRDLVVKPEFHILIRNILRRLSLIYYFHCGNQKPQLDYRAIIKYAEEVTIKSSELRWFDWERYSSRQDSRMKLGGLVGSITYEGDIEPFLPFIKAGEILHAGKNTSFGLGKYRLKTAY